MRIQMIRKSVLSGGLLVLVGLMPINGSAQNNARPTGGFTPGHALRANTASGSPYSDAGGAAGSARFGSGYLTEIGITNTGLPLCINDALTSAPGGFHRLCFGALSLGGGLISYDAVGGADPLGLQICINGQCFFLPGAGQGDVLGPDGAVAGNLPSFSDTSGHILKDSGYAASAVGRYGFSSYGVKTINTAAENATAAQAAMDAAHAAGISAICDVVGVVPMDLIVGYNGDRLDFVNGCQLKANTVGVPLISFVFAPGETVPSALVYRTQVNDPQIDMDSKASPAIFFQSALFPEVHNPAIVNVGSGVWTYNDGTGSASYPVGGIIIKGNVDIGGSYYGLIDGGYIWPAVDKQGNGVVTMSSSGANTQNANFNIISRTLFQNPAGTPTGFDNAIYASSGGDLRVDHANVSSSNRGIKLGDGTGTGAPIPRAYFNQLYAESVAVCGVDMTADSSAAHGTFASTGSTAHPVCNTNASSTEPIVMVSGQSYAINMNGNALLAATNPISNKDVFQVVPRDGQVGRIELDSYGVNPEYIGYRKNGTSAAPTAVVNGNTLAKYTSAGFDGGRWWPGGHTETVASEDWRTSVLSASVYQFAFPGSIGGDGGTPGACTATLEGGTGSVVAEVSGTIDADGHLTDPLTIAIAGDYTAGPGNTGVYVTDGSCGGLTNARVNLLYTPLVSGARTELWATVNGETTERRFLRTTPDGGITTCDPVGNSCATDAPGTGSLAIKSSLFVSGFKMFDTNGHPAAGGGTTALGTCGSNPVIFGRDGAFRVTVGTGTTTACAVTFGTDWGVVPICVASMGANNTVWITSATSTGLTLNFAAAADSTIASVICKAAVL